MVLFFTSPTSSRSPPPRSPCLSRRRRPAPPHRNNCGHAQSPKFKFKYVGFYHHFLRETPFPKTCSSPDWSWGTTSTGGLAGRLLALNLHPLCGAGFGLLLLPLPRLFIILYLGNVGKWFFLSKKSPELPEYLVPVLEHRQLPGGQLEVHGASLSGVIFLLKFLILHYCVISFLLLVLSYVQFKGHLSTLGYNNLERVLAFSLLNTFFGTFA